MSRFEEILEHQELFKQVREAPEFVKELLKEELGSNAEIKPMKRTRRSHKQKSRIEAEKRIIEFAKNNPNCTNKDLVEALGYSYIKTKYYVRELVKENKLSQTRNGLEYWISAGKSKVVKARKVFKSKYARMDRIEKILKETGGRTVEELSIELGENDKTVYVSVNDLVKRTPHIKKTNTRPIEYYYEKPSGFFK